MRKIRIIYSVKSGDCQVCKRPVGCAGGWFVRSDPLPQCGDEGDGAVFATPFERKERTLNGWTRRTITPLCRWDGCGSHASREAGVPYSSFCVCGGATHRWSG